ncbi:glycosyltransferase family 4 protein [Candidatus Nomurabacteria bacterium]|nr:glycosyltransferase family 4 protein [Candidatus Nomurabacteria bacterium]
MFGWELPPHNSGGLGTACEGLVDALTEKSVEIIFVLPQKLPIDSSKFRLIFAGPTPARGLERVMFSAYAKGDEESHDASGLSLMDEVKLYARRAERLARRENFDIIHAHDWLSFPAGLAARKVSGKPLVVHVHATEFDRGGGNSINQDVYQIEKMGMEQAVKVIAVSDWTKQLIVRHYGIAPEKIEVVHNGVRVESNINLPEALTALRARGNKIVLFVGRITLQKGPDYFILVARRVLKFAPNTYFVMAGAGDMAPKMMDLTAQLGLSDRIFFPGFLRGEELTRLYQAADLYILPSVSEPFGITPLESLAAGTPVLVSRQSGVSEVLRHALKVDFWDIDEMTNQILSVLEHGSLQQTLARSGQEEVRRVTWDAAAEKCIRIYRELC